MATDILMPKWGLTMKEGKLSRWLKSEGDSVKAGEAIFEVETDKITNTVIYTSDCSPYNFGDVPVCSG